MAATSTIVQLLATPNSGLGIAPPVFPVLDNTYGVLMIGTFVGLILYGITLHQGYRYFRLPASREDSIYLKTMVALVLILETSHSVFSMHSVYFYLTSNYFKPAVLFHGVWSVNLIPVFTGLIISVSQSVFARRLWFIERKFRPLVVLIVLLLLGETGLSTAITVEAFRQPDLTRFQSASTWMFEVGLALAVAADGMITTLLTIVLRRSRTGFANTDSMLNTLIVYTINTGLLTGTLSAVSFLMFLITPHTLIANGLNVGVAKMYANSLLAVLNSRDFLKAKMTSNAPIGLCRSGQHPSAGVRSAGDGSTVVQGSTTASQDVIEIKLAREIVRDTSLHSRDDLGRDHECLELKTLPSDRAALAFTSSPV